MLFVTADEHFGHANIIKLCRRPFESVEQMNSEIIARHNTVVGPQDTVIHVGDFTLGRFEHALEFLKQLNGAKHIFVPGNHEKWMLGHCNVTDYKVVSEIPGTDGRGFVAPMIWSYKYAGQWITFSHWGLTSWPKAHENGWQLHGHNHGNLFTHGFQLDIGVDTSGYAPRSFETLRDNCDFSGFAAKMRHI